MMGTALVDDNGGLKMKQKINWRVVSPPGLVWPLSTSDLRDWDKLIAQYNAVSHSLPEVAAPGGI